MNSANIIDTAAILIFNLTIIGVMAEFTLAAGWLSGKLKQPTSYETVITNPYGPRLRKLTRVVLSLVVLSLLLGVYLWRAH